MVAELKTLKKRFATPRRTRLVEGGDELVAQRTAAQRPNAELQRQQALAALAPDSRLLIQADGAVKVLNPQLLGRLHLDQPIGQGEHPSPARLIVPVQQQPQVLAFTADGRMALLRWEFAGQQPGNLEKFLPDSLDGASVVQVLALPSDPTSETLSLGLLSSDGRFKRLPYEDVQELSGRAATVLKLKEGVSLRQVVLCREGHELVAASSAGRVLRLAVDSNNLPLMGRTAQGAMLLRLLPGERVVGACSAMADGSVLLATRRGQVKRLAVGELRSCQRGDMGQIGLRFNHRDDALVALSAATTLVAVSLGTNRSLRLQPASLEIQDCGGSGLQLELASNQEVQDLIPLHEGDQQPG
jgi:DNA gyrase subunit A